LTGLRQFTMSLTSPHYLTSGNRSV